MTTDIRIPNEYDTLTIKEIYKYILNSLNLYGESILLKFISLKSNGRFYFGDTNLFKPWLRAHIRLTDPLLTFFAPGTIP